MLKFLLLAAAIPALLAETPSSFSLLQNHEKLPDLQSESEPIETHAVSKKDSYPEVNPVYRGDEKRVNIEPVTSKGPIVKHDRMLADQPIKQDGYRENRLDESTLTNYGYIPQTQHVGYPPYAPTYAYEPYPMQTKNYDTYDNGYPIDPDTSLYQLMWNQVSDSSSVVGFVGRAISSVFNNIFIILVGSVLTIGICTYTNLCTIAFNGVGPIQENMRSLMEQENIKKIGADLVKSAINNYQKKQPVENMPARSRRSVRY